jgi:anti-sigma factor (TIGR02949 family)
MHERDKIHCEEVITHLLQFLDGEIDDAKRAQIDRHLQECRGCFSRAEFEKALRARMAQTMERKAPAALRQRMKALIDQF